MRTRTTRTTTRPITATTTKGTRNADHRAAERADRGHRQRRPVPNLQGPWLPRLRLHRDHPWAPDEDLAQHDGRAGAGRAAGAAQKRRVLSRGLWSRFYWREAGPHPPCWFVVCAG